MLIKLASFEFIPPPDGIDLEGAQKLVHLELPLVPDVFQDFGPGPFRFDISGVLKASAGGIEKAIAELDSLRRPSADAESEPLLFSLGSLSWKVWFANAHYTRLRGGHCRYTVQLHEALPPEDHVYVRAPELAGPDRMDFYLAQAIARAKAFSLQNAIARVYAQLRKVEEYLASVRSFCRDIRSLAELPAGIINRLRATLTLVQLTARSAQLAASAVINAPSNTWSALEDTAAQVYQYLTLLLTEAKLMDARVASLPPKEQTYIVCGQDTLQSISLKFYGNVNRWQDLAVFNRVWDPASLRPGQVLIIPA